MAKVQGYTCDQCEKFSEGREGWFAVHRYSISEDPVDLCGLSCIRQFALEGIRAMGEEQPSRPEGRPPKSKAEVKTIRTTRLNVAGNSNGNGPGGATPNTDPCDVCGRVLPTRQGFAAHRRRAHGMNGLPEGINRSARSARRPSRAKPQASLASHASPTSVS